MENIKGRRKLKIGGRSGRAQAPWRGVGSPQLVGKCIEDQGGRCNDARMEIFMKI